MKIIDTLNTSQAQGQRHRRARRRTEPGARGARRDRLFRRGEGGEFRFILLHVHRPFHRFARGNRRDRALCRGRQLFHGQESRERHDLLRVGSANPREIFRGRRITSGEITIPKLSELAYEQVELSGTPFSTFIANQDAEGEPAEHSFVLRGYVRTWLARVADEFERVGLLDLVWATRGDRGRGGAPSSPRRPA